MEYMKCDDFIGTDDTLQCAMVYVLGAVCYALCEIKISFCLISFVLHGLGCYALCARR